MKSKIGRFVARNVWIWVVTGSLAGAGRLQAQDTAADPAPIAESLVVTPVEPAEPLPADAAPVKARKGQVTVEVGPELFSYRYEEPGLMKLNGFMVGLDGRLTYRFPLTAKRKAPAPVEGVEADPAVEIVPLPARPENRGVLRMDGRVAAGTADYDGALQDGTPYTIDNVDNAALEWRGLAGVSFPRDRYDTALMSGLGFRFKNDDSSSDPAGYARESRYLYLPVLAEHTRRLASGNRFTVALEFDYLLAGEQTSDLSDSGVGEIINEQNSGYGARFSVAYTWIMRDFGLTIEPFIRYWDIDDSEVETRTFYVYEGWRRERVEVSFVEPQNETLEAGISIKGSF